MERDTKAELPGEAEEPTRSRARALTNTFALTMGMFEGFCKIRGVSEVGSKPTGSDTGPSYMYVPIQGGLDPNKISGVGTKVLWATSSCSSGAD